MIDEIKFVDIVRKLVDANYFLGDSSKGWDCLNSLLHVYREYGIEMPKKFKGWNEKNYAERWEKGKGRDIIGRFLNSLGKEINSKFMIMGDLLIFKAPETDNAFPGIYLGNGNCLLAFTQGVKVIPLKFYKPYLVDCRRLIE